MQANFLFLVLSAWCGTYCRKLYMVRIAKNYAPKLYKPHNVWPEWSVN